MARLDEYDFEIAKEICIKLIDEGFKSIGEVIKSNPERYPARSTFYNWKRKNKELMDFYVNITQERGELIVEEMDQVWQDLKDGKIDPATANVLIQTLKWKASKFYPKMFGDKQQFEHSGEIKGGQGISIEKWIEENGSKDQ